MFNMGGPIKEGVMHGIREPYKHGQRVMPTSDGSRPGYAGPATPLLLAAPAAWTAARAAAMRLAPRALRGIKSLFGKTGPVTKTVPKQGPTYFPPTGRSLSSKGYPGGPVRGTPQGPGSAEVTEQIFKPNLMTRYLAGSPEGKALKYVWDGKGWVAKAAAMPFKSPILGGYLIYQGGKWLRKDGSEATDEEIAAYTKGPPGGGDPNMKGAAVGGADDTATSRAAFAKSQRDARVKKYMDLMGYDRSKKTALADALIDASKIVSARGTLDRKNITGELINPIIQAASKRLDKPEQIREAVGLMMTKAGLEKEMYEAKSKLTDELTKKRIQMEDAKLAKDSLFGDVAEIAKKEGSFPTGENLAMFARNRGISIDGIASAKEIAKWKKENEGKTDIDYITAIAKLKETVPGTYVVNDNIFIVNEDKTITRGL